MDTRRMECLAGRRSLLAKCVLYAYRLKNVPVRSQVGDSGSLCVRGYCFLRNAERAFSVQRMSRVCAVAALG